MTLKTKTQEFPVRWGGIASLTGNFSFAVMNADMNSVYKDLTMDPTDLEEIELYYDQYDKKTFIGFTVLSSITQMANGDIAVTLKQGVAT